MRNLPFHIDPATAFAIFLALAVVVSGCGEAPVVSHHKNLPPVPDKIVTLPLVTISGTPTLDTKTIVVPSNKLVQFRLSLGPTPAVDEKADDVYLTLCRRGNANQQISQAIMKVSSKQESDVGCRGFSGTVGPLRISGFAEIQITIGRDVVARFPNVEVK